MNNDDGKYKVIFVIGAPGCGKNTQCDKMVQKYNFIHFGAGDLLREEAKKNSEVGIMVKNLMDEGKIVPVKITCGLIKSRMDEFGRENIFLIDGYPRNQDNIDGFNQVFQENYTIVCTLFLTCDEETCVSRILSRSETSNRSDDEKAVVVKRFNTFFKESMPVVEELRKMGPIIEISSVPDREVVFQNICEEFDKIDMINKK